MNSKNYKLDVGKQLKQARKKLGLNQEELCRRVNKDLYKQNLLDKYELKQGRLSTYENETRQIPSKLVPFVTNALNIPLESLFIENKEQNNVPTQYHYKLLPKVTISELEQGLEYLKSIDIQLHDNEKYYGDFDADWMIENPSTDILDPGLTALFTNCKVAFSFEKDLIATQCYLLKKNGKKTIMTGIEKKTGFNVFLIAPTLGNRVCLNDIEHEFLGSLTAIKSV